MKNKKKKGGARKFAVKKLKSPLYLINSTPRHEDGKGGMEEWWYSSTIFDLGTR
jgi:hypothetical protein